MIQQATTVVMNAIISTVGTHARLELIKNTCLNRMEGVRQIEIKIVVKDTS